MKVLEIETKCVRWKIHWDETNSRLDIPEKEISGLEDIATETTEMEHTEKKIFLLKNQNIVKIWENFKRPKVHIFEASKGQGVFEEIMAP